ncbi:MAG: transaldolase [Myxococcota bacterium]|nr:transaldolase [Myxococcota bacterium]
MTALKRLHDAGQSIWLDAISRDMLQDGTLARYINDLSVTGLTSNPTIFQRFVSGTNRYDNEVRQRLEQGISAERLFFEFALQDIVGAADLFRPIYDATGGRDGFASIEVSPTLADDTEGTIAEGRALFARADRPNVLIKVPATQAGLRAIEELLFAGVPINATLLFSVDDYRATVEAYLRGIERRVEAGLDPNIPSVASLFISRWDAHTASLLPPELTNKLGIAVAQRAYGAYREILASDRWRELESAGGHLQRLLWASTGTKDPAIPDTYYVTALAAEGTVDTMPEKTLLAFGDHGEFDGVLGGDTSEADRTIAEIEKAGVDVDAVATALQTEGRDLFVESWNELLACIESKRNAMQAP